MKKINHEAECLPETFGCTNEQFGEILSKTVDSFNASRSGENEQKARWSETYAECIKVWRESFLNDDSEISAYELGLFAVAIEIGRMMNQWVLAHKAEQSVRMISLLKSAGMSAEQLLEGAIEEITSFTKLLNIE